MKALSFIILLSLLIAPLHAAYETGGVTKSILSNGATILVRPEPEAKVAAIEIFIRVGAADENSENTGIGQLLAASILAGTETRSAPKLARLISEVGGNFHAAWQWNYLEVYAVTVPTMCEETIALLSDSIQNSKLDGAAIEYAKSAIMKEISRKDEDPFNAAYTALRKLVQKGSAYDRTYLGEPSTLEYMSRNQIKDFYERNVTADRMVISIAGNVNASKVIRKAEVCFGNMPRGRTNESRETSSTGTGDLTIEKPGSATYFLLGYPAPGLESPDYPAMCVANVLLGGNKSSFLFRQLREERGFGYQVGSLYPPLLNASHLALYLGMDSARATPETLKQIKDAMLDQVTALKAGSFTNDDLERAKRYLIGNHALKHERARDRAFNLGWHEAVGLGYQYDFQYSSKIKAVTREDVVRVCENLPDEPAIVVLTGGKQVSGSGP